MNEIITITEKAQRQIFHIFAEQKHDNKGLRIAVVGRGSSGLSYQIDFDAQKEKDNVLTFEGVSLYIDPKSSIYLKGVPLDFQDGLHGKGFVFNTPTAK